MPRLPGFVGPTYADMTREVDAQETINLFPEKVESGSGANDMVLRKVPGKAVWGVMSDTPFRGAFAQDGRAFMVYGSSFYELYDTGTLINTSSWVRWGSVAVDDHPAAMASNGAGGNQLLIVSGGVRHIFSLTAKTITVVSDGILGPFRRAEFLNGYFLTMAGLFVYASNLEDGLTWNAASKFQRSAASDDLQSIVVDDHKILWLIGSKTSEPLYDAGLAPFAFTPVANSFMSHGTPARDSVTRFDNTVFMLGGSENGDRYAFVISNGQSAQRISTHAIEGAWRKYKMVSDAVAWTYSEMGHVFVVLTFPDAKATWVYDASVGMWHRRGKYLNGIYVADTTTGHCFAFGKHLVGSAGMTVAHQSLDYWANYERTGDTVTRQLIRWMRRTPYVSAERKLLRCDQFELIAETGVGLGLHTNDSAAQVDDQDLPLVSLTYSDDGGYTWASQRTRSLGNQGQYGTRVQWNRLGAFRDRVWEVNGSGEFRVTLIDALLTVR